MKLPQGNGLVLAVLRSPAHRLLSGMIIELRYTGRRTGRAYVLPVQYAGTGERLVVRPQAAQRSTWWRNFHTPTPVTVRLAGRIRRGTAQLVTTDEPLWKQAIISTVERGDLDETASLYAPTAAIQHHPLAKGPLTGRQAIRDAMAPLAGASPDATFKTRTLLANESTVDSCSWKEMACLIK